MATRKVDFMFFGFVFCFLLGAAVSLFSVYLGMMIREKKTPPPDNLDEREKQTEKKISDQWFEMLNYDGEVRD